MAEFAFCVLTEDDDMEARAAAANRAWAWRQWAMHCCEEAGGHHWMLAGDHPDDGARISLHCVVCGAGLEDYSGCFDLEDAVSGEVDGITVVAGQHDAADEFEVPVALDVQVDRLTSMDFIGVEYDVTVEIGPVWNRGDDDG